MFSVMDSYCGRLNYTTSQNYSFMHGSNIMKVIWWKILWYAVRNLYHRLVSKTVVSLYSQSSNMLNQARLKVLKVREDHVRNVLEEARRRLSEVTRNPTKYAEILNSLIGQGLLQVICWECYMLVTCKVAIVCDVRFFWQMVSWNWYPL